MNQAVDGLRVAYSLQADGETRRLDHLQWADWDSEGQNSEGHLLAATRSGKLQILNLGGGDPEILFEEDLTLCEPNPHPAPAWAGRW